MPLFPASLVKGRWPSEVRTEGFPIIGDVSSIQNPPFTAYAVPAPFHKGAFFTLDETFMRFSERQLFFEPGDKLVDG